jgi:hypothetical protein
MKVGDLYITNFERNKRSSIPMNIINLTKPEKENNYFERTKKLWDEIDEGKQKSSFFSPKKDELELDSLCNCFIYLFIF